MKNIYSNIFSFNKKNLNKSVAILKKGGIVGLPTETVYGLAGNAYLKKSVRKIYKLKKRPAFNPLIVHYLNYKTAINDVIFNDKFFKIYRKFCPGPITFILRRKNKSKISENATANLRTIAVRFPSHKIVRSILKKLNFPLAMPSANMSSKVSPVKAEDVAEEFEKKIKFILDGGKSRIGIESTVVDLTKKPKIIRPGIIGSSLINKIFKISTLAENKKMKITSPGVLKKHYSPGIPVIINQKKSKKTCFYNFR